MNVPYSAFADQDWQSRACEALVETTVYLRRQAQGWIVSIDETLLLSTIDEDEAFRCACDARHVDGGKLLRLLILSGPSAATYPRPAASPNELRGAAVHHDRNGDPSPTQRIEVAA